jgi:hypothetical protein
MPSTEEAIWDETSKVKFGLTWKGFFLRGGSKGSSLEISDDGGGITFLMKNAIGNNSLEISTTNDILLKTGGINRVQIGRYHHVRKDDSGEVIYDPDGNPEMDTDYGIFVRDSSGNNVFNVSTEGNDTIGGWNLTKNSFYHTGTVNN